MSRAGAVRARRTAAMTLFLAAGMLAAAGGTRPTVAQSTLPAQRPAAPAARLEVVHRFSRQMPVGVTVTRGGRLFVSYPRWEDELSYTLAELKNGREVPYPAGGAFQQGHRRGTAKNLVSLQGLIVDPQDRLWVLDTGTVAMKPVEPFAPKLVCIDTKTDRVARVITFPADVATKETYLNDLRIDLGRGTAGTVYITDSGKKPGLIVVDLASGRSWRRLDGHPSVLPEPGFVGIVEGRALFRRPTPAQAQHMAIGADGIAISPDGSRLYYAPLTSRRLYSVACDALADEAKSDADVAATVKDLGGKGVTDGMAADAAGRVYTTNWEHNAILRRLPNGLYETVAHDPRLLWPDTLDIGRDGTLYVISNQLHRQAGYNAGKDRRERPYLLWSVKLDTRPVVLNGKANRANVSKSANVPAGPPRR